MLHGNAASQSAGGAAHLLEVLSGEDVHRQVKMLILQPCSHTHGTRAT